MNKNKIFAIFILFALLITCTGVAFASSDIGDSDMNQISTDDGDFDDLGIDDSDIDDDLDDDDLDDEDDSDDEDWEDYDNDWDDEDDSDDEDWEDYDDDWDDEDDSDDEDWEDYDDDWDDEDDLDDEDWEDYDYDDSDFDKEGFIAKYGTGYYFDKVFYTTTSKAVGAYANHFDGISLSDAESDEDYGEESSSAPASNPDNAISDIPNSNPIQKSISIFDLKDDIFGSGESNTSTTNDTIAGELNIMEPVKENSLFAIFAAIIVCLLILI